jgi:hypothetical protein
MQFCYANEIEHDDSFRPTVVSAKREVTNKPTNIPELLVSALRAADTKW